MAGGTAAPGAQGPKSAAPSFLRRILELLLLLLTTVAALFFYKSAEEATEEKLRLEEELRRVRQDRRDDDGADGGGNCSICLSNPLEVVLQPCGHVCTCRDCGRRLEKCPICRQDIDDRRNVFLAT
jgi:hypothetical protein